MWGEAYPDFMDSLMPLACEPVEIGGRNRWWRKMVTDAIRDDPEWKGGEYSTEPLGGLRAGLWVDLLVGSVPLQNQKDYPTRAAADRYLDDYVTSHLHSLDANDVLYRINASRNYNPEPELGKIQAWVTAVNSADDFINPPELGIPDREIKKVKRGRFVLLPISDQTRGHYTYMLASLWQQYLDELLKSSAR